MFPAGVGSGLHATAPRNAAQFSSPHRISQFAVMDSDAARAEQKRIENKKKRERRAAKQAASSVDTGATSAADSKRPRVDAAKSDEADASAEDERTTAKSKALDIWDAHTVCDPAAITPNGMRKTREFTPPLIVRAALGVIFMFCVFFLIAYCCPLMTRAALGSFLCFSLLVSFANSLLLLPLL